MLCCCKRKTAYVVRISDWISDVCSSDLLERVPQFRPVMRGGNRNDRRPSESPDNREQVTSGGGDKHVIASFLDWQNRVRRIERTIIHDNRSSRSATYTSRTASNMRILKPRENRVLSRFFLHASTHRKERCGAGRLRDRKSTRLNSSH